MRITANDPKQQPDTSTSIPSRCTRLLLSLCLLCSISAHAQDLSYAQAEHSFLQSGYSTQANQALQQADRLQAEAVKYMGLPRVDLNVRAYAFHNKVEVPLDQAKSNLEQTLNQGVTGQLNQLQNDHTISPELANSLQQGLQQNIHSGVGLIPDTANVVLEDEVIRPTVSVSMPIYTGGLITSSKQLANLKAQRSQLNTQQQLDLQRFEIIDAYFSTQLKQQLSKTARFNLDAAQRHYQNALKLEQQGFINKGQRMQFEVYRNNAQRSDQNAQADLNAALFQLHNLLQNQQASTLTTPLFVNAHIPQSVQALLKSYPEQSSLIQKLQTDTELANVNIKAQSAAKKPSIYAFGEYSLDDKQNWIVGIMARYNLFSGIDKNKNIQAAEFQHYAAQMLTERTKQQIENIIYKSFSELQSSQNSHLLLENNLKAAEENLRIQELAFKEGMGTATEVIDAQNLLMALNSEKALNAYKYVMSLATLLQSHGSIDQFQTYIQQPNTAYIR
ncbi:TolC family protein [Acinetobacter larvae]|uniref:Transporter n=1 Tax=Acinetobacter larvae TaxID=1789224 RepID=A0A1B2M496_9GAMM|nr:TolC family protein [Acinetobacter larvae]AOA59989.1 transporter [Acinetobacter larvae]